MKFISLYKLNFNNIFLKVESVNNLKRQQKQKRSLKTVIRHAVAIRYVFVYF